MAIQNITYSDKTYINENPSVPATQKCMAVDMNEIKSVVNNNATELGNTGRVELWTNSSPTSSFVAQTITLNETLDNYAYYEILFRQSSSNARLYNTGKIPVGSGTILSYMTSSNCYRPTSTAVSGTTITFEAGRVDSNNDNSVVIPISVYGYKV